MKATGTKLVAERRLDAPKTIDVVECLPNKGAIGKVHKKVGNVLIHYLERLNEEECNKLEHDLAANGCVRKMLLLRNFFCYETSNLL